MKKKHRDSSPKALPLWAQPFIAPQDAASERAPHYNVAGQSKKEALAGLLEAHLPRVVADPSGRPLDVPAIFESMLSDQAKEVSLLSRVLDQIQEGICVVDESARVLYWNPAIEELYAVRKEEILGRSLSDFFPDAVNLSVLATGQSVKDLPHSPRPGTKIVISASPVLEKGRILGVVSSDRSQKDIQELSQKLSEATKTIAKLKQNIDLLAKGETKEFFFGKSPAMVEGIQRALKAAPTDVPLLILGETGTGKEVLSRFIHEKSGRSGAFVAVNCSAIPDTLFESEFFGYVRGAFTGADQKGRAGYFEQAHGGTLFLDEISELPLAQQTKLLRVLQEGRVRPLGSEKEIPVAVRIISASNENPRDLLEQKAFRVDLYYRLQGVTVTIPPLRERKEDLEDLLEFFRKRSALRYGRNITGFSPEAMRLLCAYPWYGNIRELESAVRQLVILAKGAVIDLADLPAEFTYLAPNAAPKGAALTLPEHLLQVERAFILKALEETGGNVQQSALRLGLARGTLQYRMKKLGISPTKR